MWRELQCNRRVNGYVSTNAEAAEDGEDEDAVVRVWYCQAEAENGGDENREVKCPSAACEMQSMLCL